MSFYDSQLKPLYCQFLNLEWQHGLNTFIQKIHESRPMVSDTVVTNLMKQHLPCDHYRPISSFCYLARKIYQQKMVVLTALLKNTISFFTMIAKICLFIINTPCSVIMLWFNFIPGFNFIFHCFKLISIHYHTKKQRKIKLKWA